MLGVVMLFALVTSVVIGLWGVGTTLAGLVRHHPKRTFRGLAMLTGSIAVVVYSFAAAMVALEVNESTHGTESSPSPACQNALPDRNTTITGYTTGYLPPHFTCRLSNGTTYRAHVVPRHTTLITLTASTATLALALAARSPRR